MGPNRPSRELGFRTSSQAPTSAAPSYPSADVGQVIWAENYKGPSLLPLLLLFLQLFLTPIIQFYPHNSQRRGFYPHHLHLQTRDPKPRRCLDRLRAGPWHRPLAPASAPPPQTDAPLWKPKPQLLLNS